MTISLRQLRYATALADTGHFGRAAERCFITQPALSQQIRLLEELCGTTLFDRLGKEVRLTPFGREFIERSRTVLERTDDLLAFVSGRAGLPARPLRFGLIPTVAPYLLPEVFPALRTALPEIDYAVSENHTDGLLGGLAEGTLDLALVATTPPPGGPRLTVAPLFADRFVLATGPDEQHEEPVPLRQIDTGRMLLLNEGHCFRDQTIAACSLNDGDAARAFAATSLSTIVEFVANGLGVTLLPAIAIRKETADRRIQVQELAAPGAARILSLVWREASPFAETFARIAEIITATALERDPTGI
jgi:LysR family hydrogen peroxide-inducible transcriptional activator